MQIRVECTVNAPLDEVWRRYFSPEDIVQWNAASDDWHTTRAEVDLREGGSFVSRMEAKDGSVGFDFGGTYTRVVEHCRVEYAFFDRTATVEFQPTPAGVWVAVSFDPEDLHSEQQQREGWQAILNNFKAHVEGTK